MAIPKDGSAIGRVADYRDDVSSCDQEVKYPQSVTAPTLAGKLSSTAGRSEAASQRA